MAGPGTPRDAGAARGAELYRNGPWLITYGGGTRSEDVAAEISKQCAAAGVDTVLKPIDETSQLKLVLYPGLIVVTPSVLVKDDVPSTLRSSERLIAEYRARRADGLPALRSGSTEWYAVGVVQVVGLRAIMTHPWTRVMLERRRVCVQHHMDDFEPDVDSVQGLRSRPAPAQTELACRTRRRHLPANCREFLGGYSSVGRVGHTDRSETSEMHRRFSRTL